MGLAIMRQFFASNAPWPEFLIRLEQLVRCDEAGGVRVYRGVKVKNRKHPAFSRVMEQFG